MQLRKFKRKLLAAIGILLLAILASTFMISAQTTTAVIDFEGLTEGLIVYSLSSGNGISGASVSGEVEVFGTNPRRPELNWATVFDSACLPSGTPAGCTGDDDDLFKPQLGNTLIVNRLVRNGLDGIVDDPNDDDLVGMRIDFDFSNWGLGSVDVVSLDVLDIEAIEANSEVQLYSGGPGGTLLGVVPIPAMADNEYKTIGVGISGADYMRVILNGSGAIDNVQLKPAQPPTPTNTPVPPTDTPVPPTSTNTPVPPTDTPVPPTSTNTPVPPTNTPVPTDTPTPIPPTPTPTDTPTPIPPTPTPTDTPTPIPPTPTPTDTPTPIPPTPTPTDTPTPIPPTPTPTDTPTPIPPTPTNTPEPVTCMNLEKSIDGPFRTADDLFLTDGIIPVAVERDIDPPGMPNGENLFYFKVTITVENCGTTDLTNVLVIDSFSNEAQPFETDDAGNTTITPPPDPTNGMVKETLTWNVGTISGGQTETLMVKVGTEFNPSGRLEPTSFGQTIFYNGQDDNTGSVVVTADGGLQASVGAMEISIGDDLGTCVGSVGGWDSLDDQNGPNVVPHDKCAMVTTPLPITLTDSAP